MASLAETKADTFDMILGVVLIVLGALMLLDFLDIPFLIEIVAILLIVVGIVMLVQKQNAILAVVAIALGALLLISGQFAAIVGTIITIAIGIALIVGGVLKLMGRW